MSAKAAARAHRSVWRSSRPRTDSLLTPLPAPLLCLRLLPASSSPPPTSPSSPPPPRLPRLHIWVLRRDSTWEQSDDAPLAAPPPSPEQPSVVAGQSTSTTQAASISRLLRCLASGCAHPIHPLDAPLPASGQVNANNAEEVKEYDNPTVLHHQIPVTL